MPATEALYKRFLAIDGSAYFIGGFGMTAAVADEMVVVPIRSGIGARLGLNMGYLKFTGEPTWTRSKGGETCVAAAPAFRPFARDRQRGAGADSRLRKSIFWTWITQ